MAKLSICTSCGFVGSPKKITKGSILVELALWLCLIVPGLIYSLWRVSSRYEACPECRNATMIPTGSPMGKKLVGESGQTVS